jgi:metal-responsive CopG/Arc/MetJ family transcriptional regulator
MSEEAGKHFINIAFDEKLLSRVDDFRFKARFQSRTKAIRWLIKAALDAKLAPGSD